MNATAPRHVMPHAPRSLTQCAQDGYWYCSGCERILDRQPHMGETGAYRCPRCGSGRVHFQEPIDEHSLSAHNAELF